MTPAGRTSCRRRTRRSTSSTSGPASSTGCRARRGFRGTRLLQIRDPLSPGYVLNPAVVPVHDPALITTLPSRDEWYHVEGCGHLSVEAFWQMSKVIEVRYDRWLALGDGRAAPLEGVSAP